MEIDTAVFVRKNLANSLFMYNKPAPVSSLQTIMFCYSPLHRIKQKAITLNPFPVNWVPRFKPYNESAVLIILLEIEKRAELQGA